MPLAIGIGIGLALGAGGGVPAFQRLALDARIAVLGNSKQIATGTISQTEDMLGYLRGRYRLNVCGIQSKGGTTYADYLTVIPDIAAIKPDVVFVGDATNDVTTGASGATITARLDAIMSGLQAISPRPLIVLEKTAHVSGSASVPTDTINAYIDTIVAANSNKVFAADTDTGINMADTSISPDGIHNTPKGARIKGEICGAVLANLIDTAEWWPASGELSGNLNTKWDMSGTGGTVGANVTGQVADGYGSSNASGATVVASKGTLNGNACQVFTISGTATSATADILFTQSLSMSFGAADLYEMAFEYEITAADGVSAPVHLNGFGATLTRQFQNANTWMGKAGSTGVDNTGAQTILRGIARTRPLWYVPIAGTANMLVEIGLRLTTAGAADVLVKIGRIFWRKIETAAYAAPFDHTANAFGLSSAPFISGTATVGATLTLGSNYGMSSLSGGGITFSFQWQKDGVDIPGATNKTYVTAAAGSHRVKLIATNSFGSAFALSNAIAVT